jgi:hypothetical protein
VVLVGISSTDTALEGIVELDTQGGWTSRRTAALVGRSGDGIATMSSKWAVLGERGTGECNGLMRCARGGDERDSRGRYENCGEAELYAGEATPYKTTVSQRKERKKRTSKNRSTALSPQPLSIRERNPRAHPAERPGW